MGTAKLYEEIAELLLSRFSDGAEDINFLNLLKSLDAKYPTRFKRLEKASRDRASDVRLVNETLFTEELGRSSVDSLSELKETFLIEIFLIIKDEGKTRVIVSKVDDALTEELFINDLVLINFFGKSELDPDT